ncbi:MAG: hypothetical protein J6129_05095 [Bacteroidaceae bacterium]|nr:hypothetical protein [Bacteroidaceae bacterium]
MNRKDDDTPQSRREFFKSATKGILPAIGSLAAMVGATSAIFEAERMISEADETQDN